MFAVHFGTHKGVLGEGVGGFRRELRDLLGVRR
jgi:hypothetical protein